MHRNGSTQVPRTPRGSAPRQRELTNSGKGKGVQGGRGRGEKPAALRDH
jgi:hypothetical protein